MVLRRLVLIGDVLFSHALKLAAEFDTNEVCRSVAQATFAGVRR